MKAKILRDKGTTSSVIEVKPAAWAGKEFIKYSQKSTSRLSPKAKIITQHGTSSIKGEDYPKYSRVIKTSGIKITTGKGTGTLLL